MTYKVLQLVMITALGLGAAGCGTRAGDGALLGGLGGAVVGGAIGSHSHARAGEGALSGAAVGALGGAAVGAEMDRQERENEYRRRDAYDRGYDRGYRERDSRGRYVRRRVYVREYDDRPHYHERHYHPRRGYYERRTTRYYDGGGYSTYSETYYD